MIKQNEGKIGRIIRVIIGMLVIGSGLFLLSGTMQVIAIIFGLIALVTGIVGFCGLYAIFGISTCPVEKKKTGIS